MTTEQLQTLFVLICGIGAFAGLAIVWALAHVPVSASVRSLLGRVVDMLVASSVTVALLGSYFLFQREGVLSIASGFHESANFAHSPFVVSETGQCYAPVRVDSETLRPLRAPTDPDYVAQRDAYCAWQREFALSNREAVQGGWAALHFPPVNGRPFSLDTFDQQFALVGNDVVFYVDFYDQTRRFVLENQRGAPKLWDSVLVPFLVSLFFGLSAGRVFYANTLEY